MKLILLWSLCSMLPPQDPVSEPDVLLDQETRRQALSLQRIAAPVDATNRYNDDPAAIELGSLLFEDTGLSGDGKTSCATCHLPERDLVDGKTHPRGINRIPRDTPTLHDISGQRWLGWDGRWDSLWMQALGPIEAIHEMRGDRLSVSRYLATKDSLTKRYEKIFGTLPDLKELPESAFRAGVATEGWLALDDDRRREINRVFSNVGKAIAAYERTLRGPITPFDSYLDALSRDDIEMASLYPDAARRGLKLFLGKAKCIVCHSGPLLSDGEFHDTGILTSGQKARDAGRYGGIQELQANPFRSSGQFSDDRSGSAARRTDQLRRDAALWGAFRTPSLRHLAGTSPYFHDGSVKDLRSVVRFYSMRQGARPPGAGHSHQGETLLATIRLNRQEEDDLVQFLDSLSVPGIRKEQQEEGGSQPSGGL
ncbi:MAG: cytochrome c peroxidase [Planctomycetota bacterium]|nr:cytochrome c peroxidase [Planctomycetota bacterium]